MRLSNPLVLQPKQSNKHPFASKYASPRIPGNQSQIFHRHCRPITRTLNSQQCADITGDLRFLLHTRHDDNARRACVRVCMSADDDDQVGSDGAYADGTTLRIERIVSAGGGAGCRQRQARNVGQRTDYRRTRTLHLTDVSVLASAHVEMSRCMKLSATRVSSRVCVCVFLCSKKI